MKKTKRVKGGPTPCYSGTLFTTPTFFMSARLGLHSYSNGGQDRPLVCPAMIGLVLFAFVSIAAGDDSGPFSAQKPIASASGPTFVQIPEGFKVSQNSNGSFEALLDLYSPYRLHQIWDRILIKNSSCYENMNLFLNSFASGHLWALKMSDASGRYNGGFFWGNNYWMGSSVQCYNMDPPAPFPIAFFVLKAHIQLNKTISARTHSQLMGLCLPLSCSAQEVVDIVKVSVNSVDVDDRKVIITDVKTPHDVYDPFQDVTFWIIFCVTAVVVLLASCGTLVDLYDDYQAKKRKRSKYVYDNLTYEITKTIPPEVITGPVKIPPGANNNENSEAESSERNSVNSEEVSGTSGVWKDVILAFSIKQNMKTICDQSVGEDTIPTIHGLRSISMAWVILGHTCISAFNYSDNNKYRNIVEKEIAFQTINNGPYSVDTFFFISGLLVSFLYFRTTSKHDINKLTRVTGFKSNIVQFIGMIAYRFFRLTTPYFFILGCVQITMRWFHHNSVFETPTNDYENCPKYWWRNLLYINTLYPVNEMCMLWSWYLADDTQFYILGAMLLILAVKHFRVALGFLSVFLVSSWFTTAMIAYSNNHVPNEDDPFALFDKIYDKPWTRLGPYLVGMAVGWVLFKTDCKIKMNKTLVAVGWIVSMSILLFLLYGLYGSKLNAVGAAAFSSLSHTAWAMALAWIVIACSTGYGGYVNKILAASILYPFSRVTYCAYLVHPIVIRTIAMRMEAPLHLGPEMVIVMFCAHLVLSYLIAFVVSVLFEAPVVSLLRLISPKRRKPT